MKRFIKGYVSIIIISLSICLLGTLNCCKDDNEQIISQESKGFLNFYSSNYEKFATIPINRTITRSSNNNGNNPQSVVLYADFPQDTPKEIRGLISEIENLNDIIAYHRETAVDFLYQKKSSTNDSIVLNKKQIEQAITPVIQESKNYLIEKGLTSNDIAEMIKENNSEESQLVPLVLILIYSELNNSQISQNTNKSFMQHFATTAKANEVNNIDTKINENNSTVLLDCAIEAIGLNIFQQLGLSTGKAWTKAAIKKIFKTVAKRALGPVGVAITIVEYGLCLHNKGYDCVYIVKSPISEKIANANSAIAKE